MLTPLSNAELVAAIEAAQFFTRNTGTTEAIYQLWVQHLSALLEAQVNRANGDI